MGRDADAFARAMEEAAAHAKEGRLDDASQAFRKALRHQPNEWVALVHLGACERFAGRLDEARRVLMQALLVRPEEPGTLNELSLVASAAGRRGEAIQFLSRATRAAPGFLQAWCNLGKLLYIDFMESPGRDAALGARAIAAFDRILQLDPGQVEFRFLRDAIGGNRVDAPPEGYVAGFFDRFAERFDDKVAGRLRYDAPQVAADMLAGWLPETASLSVLDLGCGTGLSGAVVRGAASHLAGVDLSAGMLERAKALGIYDELACEGVTPYLQRQPAGSKDLVLALDVLIYVGALDRIIPAIARALAPNGRAVLSVERLDEGDFRLLPTGRYAHARGYVQRLAEGAGLREMEARAFDVRMEAGRAIAAWMLLLEKPA